ncbi:TonB-dependent receptor domain-containing protein [Pseudomonas typographi]|uniref:TonB-dependent receptor domain-containing protein n=1 Tax=Pseudomonas typographi TaxID=2715964 RepID=UPI0016839578|nr:TonB-dependent receptor [Pseudomonas typographi]MBD1553120.1 TonB-dependent receptor [Pseudomonas typographi]
MHLINRDRHPVGTLSLAIALASFGSAQAQAIRDGAGDVQQFDIASGPLDQTLLSISRQIGSAISFDQTLVDAHWAPAIHGALSPEQALKLALQGSGLQEEQHDQTVVITPVVKPAATEPDSTSITPALPKVTVTAEHRASDLQTTPVAIGVVGGAELQRGVQPLGRDLNAISPNLLAPSGWQGSSAGGSFYIRGVGTDSALYPSAVALYVDDVWISRQFGNGLQLSFPDIERVEVLRGPQGTLYGQSSSGGAIKLVSRDPTGNAAWVQVTGASRDGQGVKLYASHELVPDLLYGSIAFGRYKEDGYTYNHTLGRYVDASDSTVSRVKLRFTPSPDLEAVLSVDYSLDHSDSPTGIARDYPGTRHDPRDTYENTNPRVHDTSDGATLKVVKKLDEHLSLKSITAYRGLDLNPNPMPLDGEPTDVAGWDIDVKHHQRSQEFQLLGDYDRFNYVLGALAMSENLQAGRPSWYDEAYTRQVANIRNENFGLYGQGTYKLTSQLGLTAGLRVSRDKQDYRNRLWNSNQGLQYLDQVFDTGNLHMERTSTTPKVGLEYTWSPHLFTYASVTKGEKAGGYSPTGVSKAISSVLLDPEKVTSYEIGAKSKLFDDRLQLNADVFYSNYKDYHAGLNGVVVNGVEIPGTTTVNAGKAKIYGLEFDATARLTSNLDWSVWGALQRSKIQEFLNPLGETNYKGNELPSAPRVSGGTRLNYKVPVEIPGEIHANSTVRYIGKNYSDPSNTFRVPTQTYVDAGVDYNTPDGHWTVALEARNLFNRTFDVTNLNAPSLGWNIDLYNPPRSLQASLRYDFF